MGEYPIVEITQHDIADALKPIWKQKPDTARKSINRLSKVIRHGAAMGLDVDMNAIAKAKELLGAQGHKSKGIPAMPWEEVPAFFNSLENTSPVQLALKFLILNPGPRSRPVRFLSVDQIEADVWTVPGELMKGFRDRVDDWRTPLTPESLRLLESAMRFERNGYLFPNATGRGVISDASMSRLMERRGIKYRPHGFRSSFKTWAAENRKSRDTAELCLAHKIHGAVEAAYLKTDFLEERRELMQEWAVFVAQQ